MTIIQHLVQLVKTGLDQKIAEEESNARYQPITHVYVVPRDSFEGPSFCDTPRGREIIRRYDENRREISKIHRKYWFEILIGTPCEEIYARYERDQFGNVKNDS